jgi:PGF-CTERM protein
MRPRLLSPLDGRTLPALLAVVLLCSALIGAAPGVGAGAAAEDDQRAVGAVDTVRSDTRRAAGETLNVTATPATLAAGVGDAITVSGDADADTVRLYLVGPRGAFLDADGDTASMESESGGTFVEAYRSFARRGTYTLLVVSPWTDGSFESDEQLGRDSLPTGMTHDQAVETVRSAYGGDEVLTLRLRGETPSIGMDPIEDGGAAYGEELTVSGTSNRGDGVSVSVDVLDGEGRPVASSVATVDAREGRWTTDIDTAELEPGRYTVFADDGASTASTTLLIDDGDEGEGNETTPAETPLPTETAPDATTPNASETVDDVTGAALENATEGLDDATSVVDAGNGTEDTAATGSANDTTNGSANSTTNGSANGTTNGTSSGAEGSTSEGLPGFGVGVAVVAVAVATLVGRRRMRE